MHFLISSERWTAHLLFQKPYNSFSASNRQGASASAGEARTILASAADAKSAADFPLAVRGSISEGTPWVGKRLLRDLVFAIRASRWFAKMNSKGRCVPNPHEDVTQHHVQRGAGEEECCGRQRLRITSPDSAAQGQSEAATHETARQYGSG
jgi:hypothetical protein